MWALGCLLPEDGAILRGSEAGGPAGAAVVVGAGEAGRRLPRPSPHTQPAEIRSHQVRGPEIRVAQVGPLEVGERKTGLGKVRPSEVGAGEVGKVEEGVGQVRPGE